VTQTQEKSKGLSDAEEKQLERLLARKNAVLGPHVPEIRLGEPYQALVNLSVPRRGPVPQGEIRQSDLVMAGDTLYLTDEEAAPFLRKGDKDGRRIPVIRKLHGPDSSAEPNAGRIHPQYLSGAIFRPPVPPPGTDAPRPDPAGASRVIEVPEAAPPQPGTENIPRSGEAIDIQPGSGAMLSSGQAARQEVLTGADQDLVGAIKEQSGVSGRRGGNTPNDGRR
jgi:hypothetical protein